MANSHCLKGTVNKWCFIPVQRYAMFVWGLITVLQ